MNPTERLLIERECQRIRSWRDTNFRRRRGSAAWEEPYGACNLLEESGEEVHVD